MIYIVLSIFEAWRVVIFGEKLECRWHLHKDGMKQ